MFVLLFSCPCSCLFAPRFSVFHFLIFFILSRFWLDVVNPFVVNNFRLDVSLIFCRIFSFFVRRRFPYGGAVEEAGSVLVGVRGGGTGGARQLAPYENASSRELPSRLPGGAGNLL